MRFNVSQLLRQATGAKRHYQIDEPSDIRDPHLILRGDISGEVSMLRTNRGILVRATLTQSVTIQCGRCLADMDIPLTVSFEEEYLPSIDLRTGNHLSWKIETGEETDEALLIDERHQLDLREVTRQELLLAIPAHPLCRPECRGICPLCGADQNTERCECQESEMDPRWAILENLDLSSMKE